MESDNVKELLIIVFSFPPSASIGGRRWSNLTKHISKLIKIKVITSNFKEEKEPCPWGDVINDYKENIIYLKHKTPFHVINKSPKDYIGKIQYRFSLYKASKKDKASRYDRTLYFADLAYEKIKEIITKNNIKNVLVTSGPYHLAYKISELKVEFGEKINLMVDMRDPWTEGYDELKLKDSNFKEQRKRNAILYKRADTIFVPYNKMLQNINKVWPNVTNKITILPHGFDESLFSKINFENSIFEKWYYAGTSYPNMEKEYSILEYLLNQTNSELSYYSFNSSQYPIRNNKSFQHKGLKSQLDILNNTVTFGIALLITHCHNKDFKTSKFFELLRTGKFLLYIGLKGEVSEFIKKNKLGYVIETDLINKITPKETEEFKLAYENYIPKPELYKNYSFEKLTDIVINSLI